MRCIICGEEKKSSKEHIIPEALGNKNLVTYNVCEKCNNDLGHKVDDYLPNHPLIKIIRENQHITDGSGNEVHILGGTKRGDDGRLYDLTHGVPHVVPIVDSTGKSWHVEAESVSEGIKAILKKAKREKIDLQNIEDRITVNPKVTSNPVFTVRANIDFRRVFLSYVKIAYEYSYEKLGENYYDDPVAGIFRKLLLDKVNDKDISEDDFQKLSQFVVWQNDSSLFLIQTIKQICGLGTFDPRHAILLHSGDGNRIICEILLFLEPAYSFRVCTSTNVSSYRSMNGSNQVYGLDIILKDGKDINIEKLNNMSWWNSKTAIPTNRIEFNEIIQDFVYDCPASVRHTRNVGKDPAGKIKREVYYTPVSARGLSFRSRHIVGSLLTTIWIQIRKIVNKSGDFAYITSDQSVEDKVTSIFADSPMKDPNFDLIVYQKRDDMTEAESVFYYIRNAFAHGSFEAVNNGGKFVYLLESSKEGKIKAQMRLKEETMQQIANLSKMKIKEIKALQKPKKKK